MIRYFFFLAIACSFSLATSSRIFSQSPSQPNILVLLNDQERHPVHWPKGWVEQHLPSMERLKRHGLTFHRAYTAACQCSPSRAAMMTSQFSPTNKVSVTFVPPGLPSKEKLLNLAALVREKSDYEVVWKGKWHLSFAVDGGENWSEKDIAHMADKYGPLYWNPPDAGNAILASQSKALSTLGGAKPNNDDRYVSGMSASDKGQTPGWGEPAIEYLKKYAQRDPKERKPFCLFISLVNPHDIGFFPIGWKEVGYRREDFEKMGIELPSNYEDSLKTKPSVQLKARNAYEKKAPLPNLKERLAYVNFYAYLHTVVDQQIMDILDVLEKGNLLDDTIIIRTADHGELGLSHGMREKDYTVYEEMIHIPLIVSNPRLFPKPRSTDAFYSHLDMMPTVADLVNIPLNQFSFQGKSQLPVILGHANSVRDSIVFAYDDRFFLPSDTPNSHIRCLREGDWSYAVYFSPDNRQFEYELYNLGNDPGQLKNLLYGSPSMQIRNVAERLHHKLTRRLHKEKGLPEGVIFPENPFLQPKKNM